MVDPQMEHKPETKLEKLLHGRANGACLALRGCPEETMAALRARFGDATPGLVRMFEPCRVEHPHSAFLRKTVESHGKRVVQSTLYAPGGRLAEERAEDGESGEYYVKKPQDFEVLRGFLRDVELHPARALSAAADAVGVAQLGLTPVRELEARWAGPELTRWALMTQDESAASCLRKLERQLHRRAEEACRAGCRACLLRDMAAPPLPETYMLHAGRPVEWLRHAGLFPWVEAAEPSQPLLAALAAAGAGARVDLANPMLYEEGFAPPEGMRLLLDVSASMDCDSPPFEQLKELTLKSSGTIFLFDCYQATEEGVVEKIDRFLDLLKTCFE